MCETIEASPADAIQSDTTQSSWHPDACWDRLAKHLGVGITNRLKAAERAVFAMNRINEVLFADDCRKCRIDATSYEQSVGLSLVDIEGLRIAAIELGSMAEKRLEELRDNEYGCLGLGAAEVLRHD